MTTTADFIREMRALCEKAVQYPLPGPWALGSAFKQHMPGALDRLERLEKVREAAAWRTEIDALMDYMREEKLAGAFACMTTDQFNNAVDGLFLMYKNVNEQLCTALREAEEG